MSFWKIDLTTEDGAANAAATGGMACFIAAGLTLLGAVFIFGAVRIGVQAPIVLGFAAVSIVIYLVAGWRLRGGKGAFWGGAATALLVLEALSRLIALTGLFGLVINVILVIVIANGVRGAWAMRKGGFDQDAAEVFE
ncbi:hypothetical protein [Sphingomonas sp. MS122]|uniref:hypothetical protein n=1 Tax=Sphingomonas sp. MS122 TaxID=3412683 RepID=UPI003C30A5DE